MIRHSRLTALGIVLCVLAALFAVEAKIAWFSPAGSAGAQISFAKARPAEPPKALSQRSDSTTLPEHSFAQTATLLAVALLLANVTVQALLLAPRPRQVSARPDFSVSLFFRPPPVF